MKSGGLLIATVNGFGIIIELVYVILYLIFAPPRMRVKLYIYKLHYVKKTLHIIFIIHDLCCILYLFQAKTAILVVSLNVGFPAGVILVTLFTMDGDLRLDVLGFVCAVLNILMYASPFAAMVRIYLHIYIYITIYLFLISLCQKCSCYFCKNNYLFSKIYVNTLNDKRLFLSTIRHFSRKNMERVKACLVLVF